MIVTSLKSISFPFRVHLIRNARVITFIAIKINTAVNHLLVILGMLKLKRQILDFKRTQSFSHGRSGDQTISLLRFIILEMVNISSV